MTPHRPIALARALLFGILVAIGVALAPDTAEAQKLVLVVRHAERADGGAAAGSMDAQTDPPLSTAGTTRALKLAAMLADAGVKAIFASEYRRTQDTGKPLATRLGLAVQAMASRETDALIQKLKAVHASDVVLVVGHSNTISAILKAFGGPDVKIDDSEYDNLFVIVPATGAMTRIRY